MAERGPGPSDRHAQRQPRRSHSLRKNIRKPLNWPRYMVEKSLRYGAVAFYRAPRTADLKQGFTLRRESLGRDYAAAITRANELNQHLDSWRSGRGETKELDLQPGFGTLAWLVERYKHSRAWEKVSKRSRYEYERALKLVVRHQLSDGAELGSIPVHLIDAKGVDDLYVRLQRGKRVERRLRQANLCMVRMGRAWDAVRRYYPKVVPADNPFKGVELEHGKGTSRAASRAEAYALHEALIAAGETHLAAVPLICFEWHQRPENVLAGHLTWADYRPTDRPNAVRVVHHKTKRHAWMPLTDKVGPLFPELTEYLDGLERLGLPVVLMRSKRGNPAKPFLFRTARSRIRAAAEKANLGADLTLAACRRGGLTELGDAELTEQAIIPFPITQPRKRRASTSRRRSSSARPQRGSGAPGSRRKQNRKRTRVGIRSLQESRKMLSMVGAAGFEPAAPCSQSWCSVRLEATYSKRAAENGEPVKAQILRDCTKNRAPGYAIVGEVFGSVELAVLSGSIRFESRKLPQAPLVAVAQNCRVFDFGRV
jgi:hypothetical protein